MHRCVRGCVRALLHVCACGGGSYIRTSACFVFVCSVCACLKVYNHTMRTGCIRAYVCVVCAFMYACVNCASGHVTGCSVVCSATRQRLRCSLMNIIILQGLHSPHAVHMHCYCKRGHSECMDVKMSDLLATQACLYTYT